ncbi:MAG: DUF4442 domain-containing protein [Acidobacteriota bacterium]
MMNTNAQDLCRRMSRPLYLRLYFLTKLPLALAVTPDRCQATVPYSWRTTNPFRSTYFAALSMAAELSTGLLASLAVRLAPESVSMLIVGMRAGFEKKATALTTVTCRDGPRFFEAVEQTLASGEAVTVEAETVGTMPDGTVVARFRFSWSFKKRAVGEVSRQIAKSQMCGYPPPQ